MAMSRSWKIFLWVAGLLVALALFVVLCAALLLAVFADDSPNIRDNSVLVLKVDGALPDYVPEDPFASRFLGRDDRSLTRLLSNIKKAKADKRIGAILLEIDMTMIGWGKADEIRDTIADFRSTGKPVYAYMEYGTNKEYYLATACDRIYVAPIGDLFIVGLAADVMSLGGSLDKLGVKADFYQIGKYKTAPEQYTRKEMSEASREVITSIIDEFFARYVSTIASTRKKSVEDVRALIDNAPLGAWEAKAAGLIDDAKYRDEVEDELKKRLGYKDADKLRKVGESDYRRVTPESVGLAQGERIAVIFASGPIGGGSSDDGSAVSSQSTGSDTVVKALNDARDDKTIKAIILRVDSPGGTSYASDVIWHAVEKAKAQKPVVVSMSDVAASGGYYISATASKIIAEPSTITGSIGVYAGKPVIKGFYDWIGVNNEYVLRGKQAGMFRETEPFNADERAKFESMLKSFYYDDFLPKVAKGRSKDVEYVDSIAQGRVWTGTQAKERGLVDEFGGMDKAVEVAKQLANLPADKGVRRVIFPAPRPFLQQWLGGSGDDSASVKAREQRAALESALPEDMRRALRYMSILENMKRGETMAMLPFDLQIK
ncbi:MAG TPA: signal peptide peptidase SppA [Pyrinomonadaceae bacterium]|nr:signal peptide peptidase SppA [Pyrinomonadaceae bacterium]